MTKLELLAAEALTALETYNVYNIRTDRYAHSTELIYELRDVLKHKHQNLRELPNKEAFYEFVKQASGR